MVEQLDHGFDELVTTFSANPLYSLRTIATGNPSHLSEGGCSEPPGRGDPVATEARQAKTAGVAYSP